MRSSRWRSHARLFVYLALLVIAACNTKQNTPEEQPNAPSTLPEDPSRAPDASAAAAAAPTRAGTSDPPRVEESPEVLRDKILGVNAHLIVLKTTAFAEYRDVLRVVERTPGIVAAAPFVFEELEIASEDEAPVVIMFKGVDPSRMSHVLTVGRHMKSGSLDSLANGEPAPLVLGDGLARTVGVQVGDEVTLQAPQGAGLPKSSVFRVRGTFHMGLEDYDDRLALTSLSAAQALLERGDVVLGIEATVEDLGRADEIAATVEAALGGHPYKAIDWYALNQELFQALFGERRR